MPVVKFKGYSMWILVAGRGDSLCHLPKSTGLLLTWGGEVKGVLAHFSWASALLVTVLFKVVWLCGPISSGCPI